MDDAASESSAPPQLFPVANVLGVKGALRFRRHGASQKAHVVLRRVEMSDDALYPPGRGPVAHFSLFAQKRIEVKPGKEILLSVASDDGSFTDQAVIFEADLFAPDSTSDEEEEVENQIAHDDASDDAPLTQVIPPKMRRTWTRQHEQVSSVQGEHTPSPSYMPSMRAFGMSPLDNFTPPPPTYVSVAVQAQPTCSVSAVQVDPPSPQEPLPPPPHGSDGEPSTPMRHPVPMTAPDPSPKLISPPNDRPVQDNDRSRSLSPMSIASSPCTPPPSSSRPLSPSPTVIAATPVKPCTASALAQQGSTEKVQWAHIEEAASRTSQISPVSSETVDMDLQSSPSSQSSASDDDIPGFITGAAARRARPPSPLVLPVAPTKHSAAAQTPVPPSAQTAVASPTSSMATATSPEKAPNELLLAAAPKRPPIKNPFVSGGFITEFVGEKDSLVQKKDSTDCASPDKMPSPVEQPVVKAEPTATDTVPPIEISPAPPILKVVVPEFRRHPPPHLPFSTPSQPPRQPPPSSRPFELAMGYPSDMNTSAPKSSYQPVKSANDPRLSYAVTGSISNPLNIRPSRLPPPPPPRSGSRASPPRQGNKKKVVVGNGWPHNKQPNGHAVPPPPAGIVSPLPLVAKGSIPLVRPLTPESTRSSTTPPGLSGLAPYSSPSPPGFLHSSSGPKSAVPVEQNRFGIFSQSVSSTPQIKHENNDWGSPALSQSPINLSGPSLPIQAPRPVAPASAASAILQYTPKPKSHESVGSTSATPTRDLKGKKRALTSDGDADAENSRPRKRSLAWPSHDPIHSVQIQSDEDAGIHYISLSSDGERLAVICNDRTIRIWNMQSKLEAARLAQNAPIMAVAWMSDDMGVVSLGRDGVISKWTRTNQNHWQWAKLLDAGKEDSTCFAYRRDRIAVAFPREGVKVWIWIKGTWQPQRSILRRNVTSIQFVEDGEALIGGTSDGVLWYCQVPNGTLRAYAFLKAKVCHLDVNAPGTHALVSQAGGRAHLVGIQQTDHKGKIEQVYSTNVDSTAESRPSLGAVFASGCKVVLFGSTDSNLLVWDKAKGEVICGLDHGDADQVQAVACFDRALQACIVTGTKAGMLCWWKPPLTES